jgi:hypothetical protein
LDMPIIFTALFSWWVDITQLQSHDNPLVGDIVSSGFLFIQQYNFDLSPYFPNTLLTL